MITEMMVDLIPNRENYDDAYPEASETEDTDEPDDDNTGSESEAIKDLAKEKKRIEDAVKIASEEKASASSRLGMLENYARSMEKDRPQDLEACISVYADQRRKAYEVHFAYDTRIGELEQQHKKISKKVTKAKRDTKKEKVKAMKHKMRKMEKQHRAKQEKVDTKNRLKEERIEFWPRKVYRVILNLDTNSDFTPASSRRGSIESLAKTITEDSTNPCRIALSLSYITHSAWWSPRYDLSLNTPDSSGQIVYRAEFCNGTSEVWKDTKVILSTSQTSFHGLAESIPSMQPWHIRLNSKGTFGPVDDIRGGGLLSAYEIDYKRRGQAAVSDKISEPRNALFGVGNSNVTKGLFAQQPRMLKNLMQQAPIQQPQMQQAQRQQAQIQQAQMQQAQMQQAQMQQAYQTQTQGTSLFGNSNTQQPNQGSGLFGSSSNNAIAPSNSNPFGMASQQVAGNEDSFERGYDGTGETIIPELPDLATQESEWSETGMTATYDIPGLRTIVPSHTMRRHKIASASLKDVHLSYILVPKLRTAAFLKSRIRNTSNITLLKGPVGLTLDGSFLGNGSLPRCSAGEPFSLSLGVDPSIHVTYSKPVVKRSQTGVFQKEGSGVYTRTITVTNTNSNRAVEGLILDQIPVSEDERLKVDILQPSGLRSEGDTAKSGVGIPAVGKVTERWGTARATLKKAGEIGWNVLLEASRGVKLVLEYEARFPSTELVVGC